MDTLEKFIDENLLSKENILKYIDDYSLYSYYIGSELELYTKYSSPLRLGDNDPSFTLYYSKYYKSCIFFKDHATAKSGDVFTFLSYFMSKNGVKISIKTVLLQINNDFKLCLNDEEMTTFVPHLIKSKPLKKSPVKIKITSQPYTSKFLEYWANLDISISTLEKFYVKDVKILHYINGSYMTFVIKNLTISYEILGYYKIYQPYGNKSDKFRNDYPEQFVEGALQLTYTHSFCIITKSTKECLFFYEHFGWECVAGKSENTPISKYFMNKLHKKFKTVFIWLDKDEAGIKAQNKYCNTYNWLVPITLDSFIVQKDPTDLYTASKKVGKEKLSLKYLKQLINIKIT